MSPEVIAYTPLWLEPAISTVERVDDVSAFVSPGMFQRLDKMRKQAFASVCLFGKDDDSSISGVWVWRGQDLAFPLSPDWQVTYTRPVLTSDPIVAL